MLSYVLPTRNRPERLRRTLQALGALDGAAHAPIGGGEVVVVDNASTLPIDSLQLPTALPNGLPLRAVSLTVNKGAAARNDAVNIACGEWIIMLDDDSHPLDAKHIEVLRSAPDDVAAIGAEIFLPDGSRERGGLPEVCIGCGVAIRREAFLQAGGYDATFEYYAEEYDLCAKMLMRGWRVLHDLGGRFRVLHEKTAEGRDFNAIVRRLVRNNAWVMQRYAPEQDRWREIAHIIERYAGIAMKENAARGFALGMNDLANTLHAQRRTPMPMDMFDRFTGAAHVREALHEAKVGAGDSLAVLDCGKNANVIRRVLAEFGAKVAADERDAEAIVIGTLSPGPMADSWETRSREDRPVIRPWRGF
jgi:hypothetical protein